MNISQQFAPPFRLIAPFFIISMLIYAFSVVLMFGFNPSLLHTNNLEVLGFVHLFLLGFMMMSIFGAMAQLVPVVLEVEHFAVELYYIIYPLLFIGSVLMAIGFYSYPLLLSFGGLVALIAFVIFMFETFMTLKGVKKLNFVSTTVLFANIFLLFGIIVGFVMALAYGGFVTIDIDSWLKVHMFLVLFGYVGFTIMGLSYILIPMFWLSHSFDTLYLKVALWSLGLSIVMVLFGEMFNIGFLSFLSNITLFIAFCFYIYELYLIYKTRARMQKDIYYKYMIYFGFAFILSLLIIGLYLFTQSNKLLVVFGFIVFFGVITPLIVGHLYKIIPFLVWFERFSPLVGKQKVPMLVDMVPERSAHFAYTFHLVAFVMILIALFFELDMIFSAGVSFMVFGAIFMLKDIIYMMRYKE